MEHEAEPGPAGAVGQDTAATGPGTGGETAPVEAGRVTGSAHVPAAETTGEARVDAALKLLDRLPGLPVSDHPELFEQVHARLSEVLGELESGPGTSGPAGG
jgi:hypothetical protein